MSTTEQPAQTTAQTLSGHGAAIAAVLLLSALAALIVLVFSFTTKNTDFSVDGTTATTTSYSGEDQAP